MPRPVNLDIFQDISPDDIVDVSERCLSVIAEQKDGDTIKRINIKGDKPLFVITIIEHESFVNFRAPFKLLYYITMIQKLDSMNIPSHLKELLVNITTVLLTKANVPKEEIRTITERLDERGISEMILLEDYDVQATRREARTEGRAEVMKYLQATVEFLLSQGKTITEVAAIIKVSEEEITELLPELAS